MKNKALKQKARMARVTSQVTKARLAKVAKIKEVERKPWERFYSVVESRSRHKEPEFKVYYVHPETGEKTFRSEHMTKALAEAFAKSYYEQAERELLL